MAILLNKKGFTPTLDSSVSLQSKRGFTLLEVVVALGLFSIIIFGVFALFETSSKANKNVWESSNVQAEASKAIQTFVDELRTANYSTVGGYPIASATGTEIIFYANIDSDILMERVHYFMQNDIFKKGVTKPTGTLLYAYNTSTEQIIELTHNLKTPVGTIFTYYGESYNGASNISTMPYPIILPDVRAVGITLQIKQNSTPNAPVFEVQTKVQLRNLKTN